MGAASAGPDPADDAVAVGGVVWDEATSTATVTFPEPPSFGDYRLFVCGTTSVVDLAGTPLDGGVDATFDFGVVIALEVPAVQPFGLALLALLLALAGRRVLLRGREVA